MEKHEKEAFVTSLRSALESAECVVITRQSGLTVTESSDLRAKMRAADASFKVAKNTLAKIALEGLPFEDLKEHFEGPTAIAYSKDPIAAAKVVADFLKTNKKMEIVAGAFGSKILDVSGVEALAKMPSLNELRGKIVGLLQAPATKVAGVVQAPAGQLARVFAAYASKDA